MMCVPCTANPTDCSRYIRIYLHTCIPSSPTRSHTYTRGHPPKRVPIRVCARIGGAAAHNGRAASKTGRAHPPRWRAAGRKAAHTPVKSLTRAVFHAPMSALNAFAVWNACEPSRTRSTPVERAHTFERGYVCPKTHMHAHARARMRKRGRACGARTHR